VRWWSFAAKALLHFFYGRAGGLLGTSSGITLSLMGTGCWLGVLAISTTDIVINLTGYRAATFLTSGDGSVTLTNFCHFLKAVSKMWRSSGVWRSKMTDARLVYSVFTKTPQH